MFKSLFAKYQDKIKWAVGVGAVGAAGYFGGPAGIMALNNILGN